MELFYIYKIINRSIGPLSLFFHIFFFVNQKKKQTIFTFPHDVLFIKSIPIFKTYIHVNLYSQKDRQCVLPVVYIHVPCIKHNNDIR